MCGEENERWVVFFNMVLTFDIYVPEQWHMHNFFLQWGCLILKVTGGGDFDTFYFPPIFFGQFSRHGVGLPSCISNLSDKHANEQKELFFSFISKGGRGV